MDGPGAVRGDGAGAGPHAAGRGVEAGPHGGPAGLGLRPDEPDLGAHGGGDGVGGLLRGLVEGGPDAGGGGGLILVELVDRGVERIVAAAQVRHGRAQVLQGAAQTGLGRVVGSSVDGQDDGVAGKK